MIKNRYLCKVAMATAVQCLALFGLQLSAQAQTGSPAPAPNDASSGSGELQQVTVTGYLVPHIGEGPQSVTTIDQTAIQKTGYQTITDVLQSLPQATGNFNPWGTTGFGF